MQAGEQHDIQTLEYYFLSFLDIISHTNMIEKLKNYKNNKNR